MSAERSSTSILFRLSSMFRVICLVSIAHLSIAQQLPDRPQPARLVNDLAQVLNADQRAQLESKLLQFERETSTQIAVITLKSTGYFDIAHFSFDIGEKWGVGQKGFDNGIIVTLATEDRRTFIATGYGVEDVITDAISRNIIEQHMLPHFKRKNYYTGFDASTDLLIGLLKGKFSAADVKPDHDDTWILWIVFIGMFLLILFISSLQSRKSYTYSRGGKTSRWGRQSGWGGWSNTGGGGWTGGGSSGGGFGGFGGGSFGGGGAGGSW